MENIKKDSAVIKAYSRLEDIFKSSSDLDILSQYSSNIRNCDYIICANIWHVIKMKFYLIGSKAQIIFWVQGTVAEESFLKNDSKIRFSLLKVIENICLYLSNAYIFVSPYMKDMYSRKKYVKNKPALIIPCVSDLVYNNQTKVPYSFCYLGGMSKWQCFPSIVRLMNIIDNKYPKSIFKVATNELDLCNKIIKDNASEALASKIQVCSLSSKEQIEDFLGNCSYGFLIREDILLNNVSSPIKMAEYLSCGVNVITTKAIRSYYSLLNNAGIILDSNNSIENFDFKEDVNAALELYKEVFSQDSTRKNLDVFINDLRRIKNAR